MTFIIFWAVSLALSALLLTSKIAKCKKPGWMALKTSVSGVAVMMLVNAFQTFTGVHIAVNYVTVSCAVVLGAPGAVLLLVVQLFG